MKILPLILSRIAFIRAEFAPDGTFRTDNSLWRGGSLTATERAAAAKTLTVVIVCGHGVVTKPCDSEIAARVKSDAETFRWSTAGGQLSFVRRDRLQPLLETLTEEGIVPTGVFCADAGADFATVADEYARQLYAGLRWKFLLRPTAESSAAAQAFVRRTAFPVLGLFLCLLAANALLAPRFNIRREALRTELAARERTASGAVSADARQRILLAEFAATPGIPRAVVCDRIAGAVPGQVVLTALEVEPLTKRFEERKPLQRLENRVVIRGTAPAAADVSEFVERLSKLECCRDVRLTNVEKERNGECLTFRIETAL